MSLPPREHIASANLWSAGSVFTSVAQHLGEASNVDKIIWRVLGWTAAAIICRHSRHIGTDVRATKMSEAARYRSGVSPRVGSSLPFG